MTHRFRLTGSGRIQLPAYGPGDAEHRLEKELAAIDPDGRLRITDIHRLDPDPRVVEDFELTYHLVLGVEVDQTGGDMFARRKAAFAAGRKILEGSRFESVAWARAEPIES